MFISVNVKQNKTKRILFCVHTTCFWPADPISSPEQGRLSPAAQVYLGESDRHKEAWPKRLFTGGRMGVRGKLLSVSFALKIIVAFVC